MCEVNPSYSGVDTLKFQLIINLVVVCEVLNGMHIDICTTYRLIMTVNGVIVSGQAHDTPQKTHTHPPRQVFKPRLFC